MTICAIVSNQFRNLIESALKPKVIPRIHGELFPLAKASGLIEVRGYSGVRSAEAAPGFAPPATAFR